MALAQKMCSSNNIVVCFFGDGASNQGTFHESLNMAAIWKLPILYVLENNRYAMGSAVTAMSATPSLSIRGVAYGIPGLEVDGNDILAVNRITRDTLKRIRTGGGPVLLEAHTYRMVGHSRSDRCAYRSRSEESEWAAKCPIELFQRVLRSQGLDAAAITGIDDSIAAEMKAAVEFATASGHLKRDELLANVYCQ
jgi:pyruvate dehydrogenase E1 component alpha subunit